MPLYHGTSVAFGKFKRPPHGIFFTPHKAWARAHYGNNIISVYVWAPKLYKVPDGPLLDALFDRDYELIAKYIKRLQAKGYYAAQTNTESEMICVFSNAKIYSAVTGELM